MRILFFSVFFINILLADLLSDFQQKKYQNICTFNNIYSTKNEKILSLIGVSCVKSDNLFLLPNIIKRLRKTKTGRKNAIYLTTIYFQKRLLYSYFFDNFSLEGFSLPETDYILSVVFNKIKNTQFQKKDNIYLIQYKNEIIKVYTDKNKLIIDEIKNNKRIKRHWYR